MSALTTIRHQLSRAVPAPHPLSSKDTGRAVGQVEPTRRRVARTAAIAIAVGVFVLPLIPVAVWAVADRWSYPAVVPSVWGLSGARAAWDQGIGTSAVQSLSLGVLVSALATPLGALAGRALALHRVRGRAFVTLALFAPIAVPPFAVVMGLATVALHLRIPGVVMLVAALVTAALPYTTYVMHAAYSRYDSGFDEVARTLGASGWARLRWVHLPLVEPALLTAAFLAFLVAWGDYVLTLVLGAGRIVTLQQLLGATAAGSGNEPTVAVLAVATAAPAVLMLVFVKGVQRWRQR